MLEGPTQCGQIAEWELVEQVLLGGLCFSYQLQVPVLASLDGRLKSVIS